MIKAILFDLGGVLVDFAGVGPLLKLSGGILTEEDAWKFWWKSEVVRSFEKGKITPEIFAEGVINGLSLNLTPEAFLEEFISWEKGPYSGSLQLLDQLRPNYFLACLTNNNVTHWDTLLSKARIDKKFHRCYVSYKVGLLKPEPAFYKYALKDMRLAAGDVLFLDDNEENVKTGLELGFQAFQVKGLAEVESILRENGILYF